MKKPLFLLLMFARKLLGAFIVVIIVSFKFIKISHVLFPSNHPPQLLFSYCLFVFPSAQEEFSETYWTPCLGGEAADFPGLGSGINLETSFTFS